MKTISKVDLLNLFGGSAQSYKCTALQNYINQFHDSMTEEQIDEWAEEYIRECMS
ncbi:MAG: hypothetical protein NC453_16825 [Muribaculum sp.]|nr:hypothetical protein [Muribaculum sp.]